MILASSPARARTAVAWLATALALVAGFWLLSQTTVATWLERDALQRSALWGSGQTPWQWDFSDAGTVVLAGSDGIESPTRNQNGLRVRVMPPAASISLALRGEGIDPLLVASADVELRADADIDVSLLGGRDSGVVAWAATPRVTCTACAAATAAHSNAAPMPTALQAFSMVDIGERPLRTLHLRIDVQAPTWVELRRLDLRPAAVLAPGECPASDALADTLANCPVRLARFVAPAQATPERLLWWRDTLRAERPGAVVTASLGSLSLAPLLPKESVRWLPAAFVVFGVLALAVALRMRRKHATVSDAAAAPHVTPDSRRAAIELTLLMLPPCLLLAAGWPGDDLAVTIGIAFLLTLATAIALRDRRPDWRWLGGAAAWRAAGLFTLAAAGLLLLAGTWLPHDTHSQALSPDRYWRYPLWAALQQWLLIRCIAPRTRLLVRSEAIAALLAGGLFALLHLPNFGLMLATLIGGTAWAWLGLRHRALLPLIISHALLGLLLVGQLPPWLLRSAEVGGRYLMAP